MGSIFEISRYYGGPVGLEASFPFNFWLLAYTKNVWDNLEGNETPIRYDADYLAKDRYCLHNHRHQNPPNPWNPLGIRPDYLHTRHHQNPTILTDIVKGNNAIGRGKFDLPYGYNCTKGYDPVSGLGTPDYEKVLQSAMKL